MHDNLIGLPEHPVWGTALAVLNGEPVWPQRGAADDDDNEPEIDLDAPEGGKAGGGQRDFLDDEPDDDEPDAEHDDDEPDDEPGEKAKKAVPKPAAKERTAEDWAKLEKALESERTLRRKHGAALAEYKKKERAAQAQGDDESAEQIRKATETAEAKYKPVAIRAAAKAALLEAKFQNPTDERVKKMIKRLDLEDIEIDDDGDVLGLETQIDQLVEDFPELFTAPVTPAAPAPAPKKTPRVSTSNKPPVTQREFKTTGEKIAAQITSVGQS